MRIWKIFLIALFTCCFGVANGHSADACKRLGNFMNALQSAALNAPNLTAFEKVRDKLVNDYIDLSRDLPDVVQARLTSYVRFVGLCYAPGGIPGPKQDACKTCQEAREDASIRCRNLAK